MSGVAGSDGLAFHGGAGFAAVEGFGKPTAPSNPSLGDSVYRRMIAVCDQVGESALNGADATELTRVFSQMVNKTVVLLDTAFAVRAYASGEQSSTPEPRWNPKDTGIRRVLRALTAEYRPLRVPPVPSSALAHGCLAIPIAVGDTKLGYLLVLDEAESADPDDIDLLTASYASTLFALTLAHEKTNTDLGLRYQGAVVDALVSGHFLDPDDARQKALTLGIAAGQRYWVALLRIGLDDQVMDHPDPLPNVIEDVIGPLTNSFAGAVAVARGADLVMILPGTQDELDDVRAQAHSQAAAVLTRLVSLLRARSITATPTCGLSEPTSRPDRAPQQLQQAEHALELGLQLGRIGQVITYDGLGIYRLLMQIGDTQHLLRFAEDILGPLITYEATHKLELVRTLSVYLEEHESLKQTARSLYLHANTVSYRIKRIEQLTRLNLNNSDDRLVAHVAVKIIESQQHQDRSRNHVGRLPAKERPPELSQCQG